MSIKIFDGYRVNKKDISKIDSEINRIKFLAKAAAKKELYKIFIQQFIKTVDNYLLFVNKIDLDGRVFKNYDLETFNEVYSDMDFDVTYLLEERMHLFSEDKSPVYCFHKFYEFIAEHTSQKIYHRICDFDFSLYLNIYKDEEREKYFMIPNCEQINIYLPLINKSKVFRKYPYWDNTDQDETISKRRWNRRSKDWINVIYNDSKHYKLVEPSFILECYKEFLLDFKNKTLSQELLKNTKLFLENRLSKYIDILAFGGYIKNDLNKELRLFKESYFKNEFNFKKDIIPFIKEIDKLSKENDNSIFNNLNKNELIDRLFENKLRNRTALSSYLKKSKEFKEKKKSGDKEVLRYSYNAEELLRPYINKNPDIYDFLNTKIIFCNKK